jgi:replication factor C subunit 2/4
MLQGKSTPVVPLQPLTAKRIIEPLASRCSKFRFTPLDPTSASSRLSYIASAENIDVSLEVISTLIDTSGGDLRRAITYLQSASRLSASTNPPVPITPQDIQEIAGVVPTAVVNDFARTLGVPVDEDMDMDDLPANGKLKGFHAVQKKIKEIMRQGYSASQILSQVSYQLKWLTCLTSL